MADSEYIAQKIKDFQKALRTFKAALKKNLTDLERDGAIQRFEYCFELSWKISKLVLDNEGYRDVAGPKSAFSTALKAGYISVAEEGVWNNMLVQRNLSVHTYNEKLAELLYNDLPTFYKVMLSLSKKIKKNY